MPTDEMSDEEIQQLIELGIIPDKQSNLSDQLKTAERLRYGNMPQMRQAGNVSVAANPLEFLTSGIQGYRAGKDIEELRKRQEELLQQQVFGRSAFFRALRNRQKPQQNPGLGAMPYDGEETL